MRQGIKCSRYSCPNEAIIHLGISWVGGAEYEENLCNDHLISKMESWLEQQKHIRKMEQIQ
jgi:hypothetical protein